MSSKNWQEVWSSPGERLIVHAKQENGWIRHRFISNGEGNGAVVLATHANKILFVEVYRAALDETLWELPRGQADRLDSSPIATASRELTEETGLRLSVPVVLGKVYPDSGLSGDAVNVVHGRVDDTCPAFEAEYSSQRWLTLAEIRTAISCGEIRDGITLSALILQQSHESHYSSSEG